ncbi:MAG TPA: hypothetical protein VFQ25_10845 [Ktedonobacterales bacterium]|nr:hypothetical protein [Ktedonobacterales bacterium]
MRIIVTHLTRMQFPYICVAGIDPDTGKHIRPTIKGRLPRALLRAEGGPFDIAGLVDLGEVIPEGVAPEVEDHRFRHWDARYLETCSPGQFWATLQSAARPALREVFGPDLIPTGNTCSVAPGKGIASLGCLAPASAPHLAVEYGGVRMLVSDGAHDVSLPVTDLRLYTDDFKSVRTQVVADINRSLLSGARALLCVGLTRPFQKSGDSEPRHWLQVNNIHLEGNPIWQIEADASSA